MLIKYYYNTNTGNFGTKKEISYLDNVTQDIVECGIEYKECTFISDNEFHTRFEKEHLTSILDSYGKEIYYTYEGNEGEEMLLLPYTDGFLSCLLRFIEQ